MLLSVLIPVYNERAVVERCLAQVLSAPLPESMERELIVVDDCSSDGTSSVLERLAASEPCIRLYRQSVNQGKGAAVRTAIEHARGDFCLIQDADLEYDPKDYPRLLEPIADDKADVVYGSRFIGEPHRVLYFWHTLGNKFLTAFSNMFTNLNLTDMEVCYKVFRRSVLDNIKLKCDRFGFEPEVTAKIAKVRPRLRIYEVGVAYYGRSYEEGKKITWKDGIKAILTIVRFAFSD